MRASTLKFVIAGCLMFVALLTGYFVVDLALNNPEASYLPRFWQLIICSAGATLLAVIFFIIGAIEWWANRDIE